jgi:site-specific recombinase XerC
VRAAGTGGGLLMTGGGFTSAFAEQLDAYLAFKQAMGVNGALRIWYLRKFDAYCCEHGRRVFDREAVEEWVTDQLTRSGGYRSWMSYIRDFGRWLRAHGQPDAYVLSDDWKAPFMPAHPYLLATGEIEAFFHAAARLATSSPWRWQAAAFFTLMHSCGMRTGEVRGLAREHVDLRHGHIDVVSSKGHRGRRLPVTEQVSDVLAACERASRQRFAARATFFVSSTGAPVTAATVCKVFHRI